MDPQAPAADAADAQAAAAAAQEFANNLAANAAAPPVGAAAPQVGVPIVPAPVAAINAQVAAAQQQLLVVQQQLAQAQLDQINRQRDTQDLRDEVAFKSKIQETVSRTTWPSWSKDSKVSTDVFLGMIFDSVSQSASILTSIVMNHDERRVNVEAFMAHASVGTLVNPFVTALSVIVAGDAGRFGRGYRANEYLKTFEASLYAAVYKIFESHPHLTSIVTTSNNHHYAAGLHDRKSGLILLLTIKSI